tara:strand:+ start:824 stop:1057 length:234 start_codon:yes stop_codon:yes gene_type:complete
MPIESFIHQSARSMLGVKDLPLDLRNYLDDIEMYANLVDGTVASRQVVAIALASYRRLRSLELDLDKTDWNGLRKRK